MDIDKVFSDRTMMYLIDGYIIKTSELKDSKSIKLDLIKGDSLIRIIGEKLRNGTTVEVLEYEGYNYGDIVWNAECQRIELISVTTKDK